MQDTGFKFDYKVGTKLTLKQELFCQYYTKNDDLFGNATLSYAQAYGYNLLEADKDDAVYEEVPVDDGSRELDFDPENKEFSRVGKIKTERRLVKESTHTRMYNTCSICGSQLLRNPKINDRIKDLLNEMMNDREVDSELMKVIKSSKSNDAAKVQAIKEYNKLKQRIIERSDITSDGKPIIMDASLINKYDPNRSTEDNRSGHTPLQSTE